MSQVHSTLCKEQELHLAGDGHCDSAGHSATYGTYSLMDTASQKILACHVIKVREYTLICYYVVLCYAVGNSILCHAILGVRNHFIQCNGVGRSAALLADIAQP